MAEVPLCHLFDLSIPIRTSYLGSVTLALKRMYIVLRTSGDAKSFPLDGRVLDPPTVHFHQNGGIWESGDRTIILSWCLDAIPLLARCGVGGLASNYTRSTHPYVQRTPHYNDVSRTKYTLYVRYMPLLYRSENHFTAANERKATKGSPMVLRRYIRMGRRPYRDEHTVSNVSSVFIVKVASCPTCLPYRSHADPPIGYCSCTYVAYGYFVRCTSFVVGLFGTIPPILTTYSRQGDVLKRYSWDDKGPSPVTKHP